MIKAFLCAVMLLVCLASVSVAQQQLMQIRVKEYPMLSKLKVVLEVYEPGKPLQTTELEPMAVNTAQVNSPKNCETVLITIRKFLEQGWNVLSVTPLNSTQYNGEVYTLVKN